MTNTKETVLDKIKQECIKVYELSEKQKEHVKNIQELIKEKEFVIVNDLYKNMISLTGTNYKGRKCLLKRVIIHYGNVMFQPLILDLKTKEYTIYHRGFCTLDYFAEVSND